LWQVLHERKKFGNFAPLPPATSIRLLANLSARAVALRKGMRKAPEVAKNLGNDDAVRVMVFEA
jgi:hypothetical protein